MRVFNTFLTQECQCETKSFLIWAHAATQVKKLKKAI